jgi:hypothetical protein
MKAFKIEKDVSMTEGTRTFTRKVILYAYTTGFDDLDDFFDLGTLITVERDERISRTRNGINFLIDDDFISMNSWNMKVHNRIRIDCETMDKINAIINPLVEFSALKEYDNDNTIVRFGGFITGHVQVSVVLKKLYMMISFEINNANISGKTQIGVANLIEERASFISCSTIIDGAEYPGLIQFDKTSCKSDYEFRVIIAGGEFRAKKIINHISRFISTGNF